MRESTTSPPTAAATKRPKKTLTDRGLKALEAAPKGETYDQMDGVVPGLGIRVSETSRKTFILVARYPGSRNPTRRSLGLYGALTLEQARNKARDWLELIRKGIDPRDAEERQRSAEQRKRANTFRSVAEDFIKFAVIGPDPENPKQRRGAKMAREIRRFFVPLWGGMPITEITRTQVQTAIKGIRDYGGHGMLAANSIKTDAKRKRANKAAPGQARNLLGNLKTLFSWAIEQNEYGIESSPCRDLKAKTYVGVKKSRNRALTDLEVAALWRATRRLRYPFRQVYRMLLLSGLRLNEVAGATWSEFDLKDRIWTIPANRMKGTSDRARPHAVPLTPEILAILDELPRFNGGEYLFSLSQGARPSIVANKIKTEIDARMVRSLRALVRMRGENPDKVSLDWVNHDLRRTVRTGLSKLRIDSETAEAVLAHAKVGIIGTYNVYDLFDEKREALEKWAAKLREITTPPPPPPSDNIVKLPARA